MFSKIRVRGDSMQIGQPLMILDIFFLYENIVTGSTDLIIMNIGNAYRRTCNAPCFEEPHFTHTTRKS